MTMNVRQSGAFSELIRKEERAREKWNELHGAALTKRKTMNNTNNNNNMNNMIYDNSQYIYQQSALPEQWYAPAAPAQMAPPMTHRRQVLRGSTGSVNLPQSQYSTQTVPIPIQQQYVPIQPSAPTTSRSVLRRSLPTPLPLNSADVLSSTSSGGFHTSRYQIPVMSTPPYVSSGPNYHNIETTRQLTLPLPSHLQQSLKSPLSPSEFVPSPPSQPQSFSKTGSLAITVPVELARYVPADDRDGEGANGHFLAAGLGYGSGHRNHFKYRHDNREGRTDLAMFRSNHIH